MIFRETRKEVSLASTVADGFSMFKGTVENVSMNGIKVTGLPLDFDTALEACMTVIDGPNRNFRLLLQPRWSQSNSHNKEVGFKIISAPFSWRNFLADLL